jgi:biotin carboxyl carrier protein
MNVKRARSAPCYWRNNTVCTAGCRLAVRLNNGEKHVDPVCEIAAGAGWRCTVPLCSGLGALGCIIEPDATTALGSPLVGVVKELRVERGDAVRSGDVIAVLDDAVARAAVATARSRATSDAEIQAADANVELTAQRQTRAQDLSARKMIAQDALEDAQTQARLALRKREQAHDNQFTWQQELGLAEARLEQHVIRSPIDGIIVDRLMSPGERVEEQPLVRIARIDPVARRVGDAGGELWACRRGHDRGHTAGITA